MEYTRIINVNRYLRGNDYNTRTIIDDINYSFDLIREGADCFEIRELKIFLDNVINEWKQECYEFYQSLTRDYGIKVLNNIDIYSHVPFRKSRNPLADYEIIKNYYQEDFNKYPYFINSPQGRYYLSVSLLLKYNDNKPGFDNEKYERGFGKYIENAGSNNPITFEFMNSAKYVGHVEGKEFPENYEDLVDYAKCIDRAIGFCTMKYCSQLINQENNEVYVKKANDLSNIYYSAIVGYLGEFYAIEYLKQVVEADDEILWVSKVLGDGFGFDIVVLNKNTKKTDVYEIKATTSESKIGGYDIDNNYEFKPVAIDLTNEECKIKNEVLLEGKANYHMIEFLIDLSSFSVKKAYQVDYNNPGNSEPTPINFNETKILKKYTDKPGEVIIKKMSY